MEKEGKIGKAVIVELPPCCVYFEGGQELAQDKYQLVTVEKAVCCTSSVPVPALAYTW